MVFFLGPRGPLVLPSAGPVPSARKTWITYIQACMPVYMNSGKIVADGRDGKFEGSTRGPRGPKKNTNIELCSTHKTQTKNFQPTKYTQRTSSIQQNTNNDLYL